MLRRILLSGAILPFVLGRPAVAAPAIRAIASFSILGDLTRSVAAGLAQVSSLVGPDGDVHVYEPRPADLRALAGAQLLVENGLGLEGWMARLAQASGFRGERVVASTGVVPHDFIEDGVKTTDPHAWQNPRNALIYVRNIAAGLSRALPDQAHAFDANAAKLSGEIAAADADLDALFQRIPLAKRRIITSHDAFGYFAERYDIEMHGIQGLSTEGEPSAKTIAALVALIRREGIKAVFVENMTGPRIAATLAHEAGAALGPTVYSDALSGPSGPAPHYVAMLRYNAHAFAQAMAAN